MSALLIVVQMIAIIVALLAIVGGLFYAICWVILTLVRFFPIIGKQYRHGRWDELNRRPRARAPTRGDQAGRR